MTQPTLDPVAPSQLLQAMAVERIRDAILEGTLAPGTPLRVSKLAQELGVSPIPVREALQVLATEGLAVHLPRRGMVVSQLTAEDIANTYDVRGALEGMAAQQAAGRLTPAVAAELRATLKAMEEATQRLDHEALLRLDRTFHAIFCAVCPNRRAGEFLRQIWNYTYRVRRVHPRSETRLRTTVAEHRAILDALLAGDGELAGRLVREHMAGARDDLLARLEIGGL